MYVWCMKLAVVHCAEAQGIRDFHTGISRRLPTAEGGPLCMLQTCEQFLCASCKEEGKVPTVSKTM